METVLTIGAWNSLATTVSAGLTGDGLLKSTASISLVNLAITSAASISKLDLIQTAITSIASIGQLQVNNLSSGVKGHFLWTVSGALTTSLATSSNNSQISFLRATKNLTLQAVYAGLNSAPSLAPLTLDIAYKSTPTGITGTSIFSVRPLVGIGLNENTAGATGGTLSLTSLASGVLLYPEIRAPGGASDLTLQIIATERV